MNVSLLDGKVYVWLIIRIKIEASEAKNRTPGLNQPSVGAATHRPYRTLVIFENLHLTHTKT